MPIYPTEFLEQIKNKTDIVTLIGRYTNLQRKGRDHWGCCPFHSEKTPSFCVHQDTQIYKCFGCGKHGNVFTFLMEFEKMTFVEAAEWLAKDIGLQIPDAVYDDEYRKRKELIEKIHIINREAARFYHNNLKTAAGEPALEYLAARGLDKSTVTKFGLGYSVDFHSLPEYLMKKGFTADTLVQAGIASRTQNNEPSDFFGKRFIIPIISANGHVIGFTGRDLKPKPDFAKYKNTPATAAFDKKKNLFGINYYKQYRQTGVRSMILVEGHMDVIGLYQQGVQNAVASMGTSLTAEQCREIRRFADVVYVSFDGDSAGQDATIRGLELLKNEGLEIKVVSLPDKLDPDDYVRKFGKAGYEKLLDEALPLIDFKLKKVEERHNFNSYDGKTSYVRDALSVLAELDSVERNVYVEVVSKKAGWDSRTLLEQINNVGVREKRQTADKSEERAVATDERADIIAARFVLSSILHVQSYVSPAELDKSLFSYEKHCIVYQYILKCVAKKSAPNLSDLFDELENSAEVGKIIDSLESVPKDQRSEYYTQCIKKLKKSATDKEIKRLVTELNMEIDDNRKNLLKEQILKITVAAKGRS